MALNNVWEDKQDGIDDILSNDINDIAHAVIEDEKGIEELKERVDGINVALQEKANTKMLKNTDISQISESGIYQISSGCSGLPDDLYDSTVAQFGCTLIVSEGEAGNGYSQYLIYNHENIESTVKVADTRIYACYIYNPSGTPSYDMPWTLIYDTSKPQLTLDNTLTKEDTAADSKAVGDALSEKADLSFVEKLIPRGEANGNPVTIKDSLEGMPAIGYKIYGESVQDGIPSPDSPVPIKSVGDLVTEGEQSGKYKIPVTVIGKNMLNVSGSKTFSGCTGTVSDGELSLQTGSSLGNQRCMYTIKCTPNTTYTFSFKCDMSEVPLGNEVAVMVRETTAGGGTLGLKTVASPDGEKVTDDTLTFTSGDRTQFVIWFMVRRNTVTEVQDYRVKYLDIQVEENTLATEYQQYILQEYDVYTDEPLRKVGDTADYIDYEKGQIVKNVDVIDGTGTKTVEESYAPRSEPEYIDVSLPDVLLPESPTARVEVETSVKGTFSIKYYQDINKKLKELQSLIALNIPSTLPAEILEE